MQNNSKKRSLFPCLELPHHLISTSPLIHIIFLFFLNIVILQESVEFKTPKFLIHCTIGMAENSKGLKYIYIHVHFKFSYLLNCDQ